MIIDMNCVYDECLMHEYVGCDHPYVVCIEHMLVHGYNATFTYDRELWHGNVCNVIVVMFLCEFNQLVYVVMRS